MSTLNLTQKYLPESLQHSPVFESLGVADNLDWLSYLCQQIVKDDVTSLPTNPNSYENLGVPSELAAQIPNGVANWLCKSVGAVDGGFFIQSWNVLTKLTVAANYLPTIVAHKGTYSGLDQTLAIFTELGFWDNANLEYQDTAPNFHSLDIHTPSIHLSFGEFYDYESRLSIEFLTAELILKFHNPAGLGEVWVDWSTCYSDFAVAGDRCS